MRMWVVINTVYFNDGTNEIYGYAVRDEESRKRRIVSSKTANTLTLNGILRVAPRHELSFVSVGRDYVEKELD